MSWYTVVILLAAWSKPWSGRTQGVNYINYCLLVCDLLCPVCVRFVIFDLNVSKFKSLRNILFDVQLLALHYDTILYGAKSIWHGQRNLVNIWFATTWASAGKEIDLAIVFGTARIARALSKSDFYGKILHGFNPGDEVSQCVLLYAYDGVSTLDLCKTPRFRQVLSGSTWR